MTESFGSGRKSGPFSQENNRNEQLFAMNFTTATQTNEKQKKNPPHAPNLIVTSSRVSQSTSARVGHMHSKIWRQQ